MSSPRVYWRGRIHPLGRIGGYKRLRALPCTSQIDRPPPRDPRRATGPDDYGAKDSRPSKQKLCKRRQDSDPATDLQADFDKRQRKEEFLRAVNRKAEGKPLSVALQAARDEPSEKAAPLGKDRVAVKQNDSADRVRLHRNDKADRARLTTHDGGDVNKADFRASDHGF